MCLMSYVWAYPSKNDSMLGPLVGQVREESQNMFESNWAIQPWLL